MNLKIASIAVLFAVLAGGVGFYIWHDISTNNQLKEKNQSNSQQGIDLSNVGVEGTTTGGLTIKRIPVNNSPVLPPMPNLDRPIVIPESIPQEVRRQAIDKIKANELVLKKDPTSIVDWIGLGVNWKYIDDYEGARVAWEYAALLSPKNYVPFYNLGGLYGYYLHENAKAEANYKTALVNGPQQIYIWRDVYSFYRDVMKDDAKAKKTLTDGIAKNPDTSKDLQYLLEHY